MIEPLLNPREATMGWVRGACAITLCLLLFVVAAAAAEKDTVMSDHATGTFEVKIVPETIAGKTPSPGLSQMSIDKTFHGDLEGTSRGSMISAGDPKAGEAGYVAMETVTGTLKGHAGSFALMHRATMSGGTAAMEVRSFPARERPPSKASPAPSSSTSTTANTPTNFDYTLPKGE